MKKYCRYCEHMICGDANYCSMLKATFSMSRIKRVNECPLFELNEMDALAENEKGYIPRQPKKIFDKGDSKNQLKLEGLK